MNKIAFIFVFTLIGLLPLSAQHKKHEMRAVWIATVANIDWPSSKNMASRDQQTDMIKLLDTLSENNINTVIMQIRPTADTFYPSVLEPWSHWLTGIQGEAPAPFYDPLKFIIEEAHKRCIDVHVWLNPYRVTLYDDLSILDNNHLYHKDKSIFVKYGGKYYFDPGYDKTRSFLNKVVKDIVERYDIDAIHFDDYFYPYKVKGEEFPDDETFRKHPRGYAPYQKDDWRRNNVNMIISELQQTIKSNKPWVEFGISPFGVWRNNDVDARGSATKASIQNYDDLYADILKWLEEGTIDYVMPQLYWEIGKEVADYKVLAEWWSENSFGRNLYIGLNASNLGSSKDAAWTSGNELARQLELNKQYPQIDGSAFFSAKTFIENRQGLNDSLQNNFYKYPALCPVNRNIKGSPSGAPENLRVIKDGKDNYLYWDELKDYGGHEAAFYVVYAFKGKRTGNFNDPANIIAKTPFTFLDLKNINKKLKGKYTFVVTSVNRFKHESVPVYSVTRKL